MIKLYSCACWQQNYLEIQKRNYCSLQNLEFKKLMILTCFLLFHLKSFCLIANHVVQHFINSRIMIGKFSLANSCQRFALIFCWIIYYSHLTLYPFKFIFCVNTAFHIVLIHILTHLMRYFKTVKCFEAHLVFGFLQH